MLFADVYIDLCENKFVSVSQTPDDFFFKNSFVLHGASSFSVKKSTDFFSKSNRKKCILKHIIIKMGNGFLYVL